jgi:hypothetical protein
MIMSANAVVFSQTAVTVPDNFIGTWWADVSKETDVPEGLQLLTLIEIKRDGTWVMSAKLTAYKQNTIQAFTANGFTNPYVQIAASGYITAANSVEMVMARLGETREFDRILFDGNGIVIASMRNVHFTKNEPPVPEQ